MSPCSAQDCPRESWKPLTLGSLPGLFPLPCSRAPDRPRSPRGPAFSAKCPSSVLYTQASCSQLPSTLLGGLGSPGHTFPRQHPGVTTVSCQLPVTLWVQALRQSLGEENPRQHLVSCKCAG